MLPLTSGKLYLNGSGQVGPLLAQVEQAGDGHPVGQVVDEGHIVDQVVRLSNTHDEYCGETLEDKQVGLNRRRMLN